jgi:hypothetical protein
MTSACFIMIVSHFTEHSMDSLMNIRPRMAFALAFALALLACGTAIWAQPALTSPPPKTPPEEPAIESLIGENARFGGYGGPVVKFSPVKGTLGTWVGGYGGMVVNGTLFIGGFGYGLSSDIAADQTIAPQQSLAVGYGGVMLEYIGNSDKLLHYGIQLGIGWGGAGYVYRNFDNFGRNNWRNFSSDAFFVLEPGAYAELNIAKWFRIGVGASYRYVNGVELQGLSNGDLSGISGNLLFKFGSF